MAFKPVYALHKDADGAIITTGSFDYSFKLNEWIGRLNVRPGDVIEFGGLVKREDEQIVPAPESVAA